MDTNNLNDEMVWAAAHDYTKEGIWYCRIIDNTCILSDEEGNSDRFPIDYVNMRKATIGELVDCFFEKLFPELEDKKEELLQSDQAKLKIAIAVTELHKRNARQYYIG